METVETARLTIRAFVMDDLVVAYQLYDQDLAWAGPEYTLEQRQKSLQFHIALANWWESGRHFGNRAIILRDTSTLIGLCHLWPGVSTPEERSLYGKVPEMLASPYNCLDMHVGYAIATAYRRQGYATEAVRALIDYAFQEIRVPRVLAKTERGNEASVRVMRSVGMQIGYNPAPTDYPAMIGIIENPYH